MKKKYMKPSLTVYELQQSVQLLNNSVPKYLYGPVGYAPGVSEEEKILA